MYLGPADLAPKRDRAGPRFGARLAESALKVYDRWLTHWPQNNTEPHIAWSKPPRAPGIARISAVFGMDEALGAARSSVRAGECGGVSPISTTGVVPMIAIPDGARARRRANVALEPGAVER
jgi:hypothetical protein